MTTITRRYKKQVMIPTHGGGHEIKEYDTKVTYSIRNNTGVKRKDVKAMLKKIRATLAEYNKISPFDDEFINVVSKVQQLIKIIDE